MLITLARKPLGGATVVQCCLQFGCGALNIDATRIAVDWTTDPTRRGRQGKEGSNSTLQCDRGTNVKQPKEGRWPANVLVTGSEAVLAGFPVTTSGTGNKNTSNKSDGQSIFRGVGRGEGLGFGGDTGSAARFFKRVG